METLTDPKYNPSVIEELSEANCTLKAGEKKILKVLKKEDFILDANSSPSMVQLFMISAAD